MITLNSVYAECNNFYIKIASMFDYTSEELLENWNNFFPKFIVNFSNPEDPDGDLQTDTPSLSLKEICEYVMDLLNTKNVSYVSLEIEIKKRDKKIKKPIHKINFAIGHDFSSAEELYQKSLNYVKSWFGDNFKE